MGNPFDIVHEFENTIKSYTGAPFAVATDCCTHALFLSLYYEKHFNNVNKITLPKNTYVSVPMQAKHLGLEIEFEDLQWEGSYRIGNTNIVDSAARFTKGCYENNTTTCLSFQFQKILSTIRGGMILTNNWRLYQWAKRAVHDGRDMSVPYEQDKIEFLGWHYFMTPEQAQMGLDNFKRLPEHNDDIGGSYKYPDISYVQNLK